ncbi:MAG: hypothetical protein IKV94_02850 [Clostridia bacterium]|nr:hypothetical protein [Clostridia bacterium]MBR6517119.1 hypothetical protein [Bacilli bacterium]
MKDVDFSCCPFIRNELCFLTYNDFCHNAKIIKFFFEGLDYDAKIFYKWYLYSNIHMTERFKDKIWEFLNNPEPEYYIELITAQRKYKPM